MDIAQFVSWRIHFQCESELFIANNEVSYTHVILARCRPININFIWNFIMCVPALIMDRGAKDGNGEC